MRSRTKDAISLIETVLGGFLILCAILILAALVDSSLRRKAAASRTLHASNVAENKLESLRALAYDTNFRSLDAFNGEVEQISGFKVETSVRNKALLTPSSGLEGSRKAEDQRRLDDSVRQVDVKVSWGQRPEESYTLTSYVADLANKEIVLNLKAEPDKSLRVSAVNENGVKVEDLSYRWYVKPLTGLVSISDTSPSGDRATYVNETRGTGNRVMVLSGECTVSVRAVYEGRVYEAETTVRN